MLILGVECTASPVSVALCDDGLLVAEYFLNQKITHSQTLLPMCENLLNMSGVSISDIDCFAVTAGPGSFTGVRIGISAVKGLAQGLSKPCVPVSVLEAMAYGFLASECYVCATMDARCNQVYNALFKVSDGVVTRLCEDRALMIDELIPELCDIFENDPERPIFLCGDGAEMLNRVLLSKEIDFVRLAPENIKLQRASGVCAVATALIADGKTVTARELQPFYLRLPQAERELKLKQK